MSDSLMEFLRSKKETKKSFTEALNFNPKLPLITLILDDELDKKEQKILDTLLEGCQALDTLQIVLLTDSESTKKRAANIIELPYSEKNRRKAIEAADMALTFNFSDIEELLMHGTIPISSQRPNVENYDPNSEQGNSFTYNTLDPWSVFASIVRATETYKFPYDWKNIIRQGLSSVAKD